jgi:acetate---CoA ligase (ADP-forming)
VNDMARADGVRSMLEAKSVAVIGASARPQSPGQQMLHQLVAGGFAGRIVPVNPKYEELEGLRCYPSLSEVPGDVDLALLGVPNNALEEQLEAVAERGIHSAVIFASGYPGDPGNPTMINRLRAIALENGITICGGNCMGFANFQHGLRALVFEEDEALAAGPIAWITHSGSAFTALLHNDRHLRFSIAVSAGQELTTTVADYIRYAVGSAGTRVVALFLETVRDPANFRDALEEAAEAGVPVVALKVGRAEQARTLVSAHSGALAGEDAVFDAVFDAHGVVRVRSLNEMADVLELLSSGRKASPGGLGSLHDSGGERAHLIDVADQVGLNLADVSPGTRDRLAAVLEPGLPPVNPVDAWGTGNDYEKIFLECFRALNDDDGVGALTLAVDLAGEIPEWGYADIAEMMLRETDKPFAVMSNLSAAIDDAAAARLRRAGVPVLEDTFSGLLAFKRLFGLRDLSQAPPLDHIQGGPSDVREKWIARLRRPPKLGEVEALQLFADYGIPVAPSELVSDLDELVAAGERIGYPVALKITGRDHKADAGGVILGIEDELSLIQSYKQMSGRFGSELVVQRMAEPGVELALGMVRDEQFGPVVVVAAGGHLVEMLDDRRLALPPLDSTGAMRLVESLRVGELLKGFRGSTPGDAAALSDAIARLSVLATDLGEYIEALDLNPLVVSPSGAAAVDGLVIPRSVSSASP